MNQKNSKLNTKYLMFPFVLVFLEIITYLSMDMYLPALPMIGADLEISQDLVQYTQTFWFLGATSMQLFLGPITERVGRRPILIFGILLFIVAGFICSITTRIDLFLFGRLLQGVTVSIVIVAGYATIHELFSGVKAIQILATMGSVTILAPALGPVLGAIIISQRDWQTIFCLLTFAATIGIVGLYFFMPDQTNNFNKNNTLRTVIQDYKLIFTNKKFMQLALTNCLIVICFFIWLVESPFIIINTYSKTEIYFGIVQFFVFGSYICGAQLSKRMIKKVSGRKLLDTGLSVVGISASLFVVFASFGFHINIILAAMMGIAMGAAMVSGLLNRLAIESATQPMSQRVALFSTLVSLAACVGSYVVTYINDMTFDNIGSLMLFFIFIALANYLGIRNKIELKV